MDRNALPFLPSVRISLKLLKHKDTDYEPTTVGDHLKKRRMELGLTQIAVARHLGVSQFSIINWEKHGMTPPTISMVGIIGFLGATAGRRGGFLGGGFKAQPRAPGLQHARKGALDAAGVRCTQAKRSLA